MGVLSFGPNGVDYQDRINYPRMREERMKRTREKMKKHGIPALLLFERNNIRYATSVLGVNGGRRLRFALVFAEHDPIIYEHADIGIQQLQHCSWIKPENMRVANTWLSGLVGPNATKTQVKKWIACIKQDLEERGLLKEKLGADSLDRIGAEALKDAGIHVVDGKTPMVEARMIKTEDEINCLKMADAILDRAWYKMYEAMKPGVKECELMGIGLKACWEMGVDFAEGHVKSGPRGWPNYRGPLASDRIIQPGDILFSDLYNCTFAGYNTCYYRCFIVGREPNAREKEWYKKCHAYLYDALEEVKPGKTTADAAKRFPPASTWGYKSEEATIMSQFGHGIGLDNYEQPLVARAFSLEDPQPFEKGMVLAFETQEGELGLGGVRLEEEVLVTDNGCEVITRWPHENIITVKHSLIW
jgi:Xaa-Pro aminopeptidase